MPAMTLARPRLMQWNTTNITEHNRKPLSISVDRIEKATRMANGTMRKYWIADKHSFSVSWDNLPRTTVHTVDGFAGGDAMKSFYDTNQGAFPLKVYYGDGTLKTYSVMFTNFSVQISKRGLYDFWDVNCEMVEV